MTDDDLCPDCGGLLPPTGGHLWCDYDPDDHKEARTDNGEQDQGHPDYHAGWTVQRFRDGDERGVTLECPDLRRHHLTDEQAVALAESLLKYADIEGEEE